MTRGRPFEPGNQFGRGRPKGSPNKKTHLAHKIFDDNAPAIMALAINSARQDRHLLRMLASHLVPRRRELPIKSGRLVLHTLGDLDRCCKNHLERNTSDYEHPSLAD